MKQAGQIILFRLPQTDFGEGKLRPALLLGKLPGRYDDWLICMISSQLHHEINNFDEVIKESDSDFTLSGLKAPSLIRIGRLAVVEASYLAGSIGTISAERLARIQRKISEWLIKEL